jgi:uncharacterized protein YndB with AHSA1/START domain
MINVTLNPATDLVLDRYVEVPPALVWKCWTEPEHLMPWFCPVPWRTTACTVDLRPGGGFYTKMEGPEGESHEGTGCYLEVVPQRRLTWTSALGPDFRPNPESPITFTAVITLEPKGNGTRYLVHALHPTAEGAKAHADMGFVDGWGKALDQLVAYAAKLG